MTRWAEVVVTLPVEGRFHYAIPPHLDGALEIGHRVLVPFGRRRVTGFVLAFSDVLPATLEAAAVKPILERLDPEPLVPHDVLQLAAFAADYYLATPGEVLKIAMPPGLTAASKARWKITPHGRHWLEGGIDRLPNGVRISNAERALLEAAVKGAKLGDAPAKAASNLEALGFIARKDTIEKRESEGGEVELVERTASWVPAPAQPREGELALEEKPVDFAALRARALKKPTRRDLYFRLADGPLSIDQLELELGGRKKVADIVGELEAAGLVTRRRVAAKAGALHVSGAPSSVLHETPPKLTDEQTRALAALVERLDARSGGAFLLHGVTASGKTEVYLHAIAHARAQGGGAIVLVPEIALTPQLESRFRARFGDEVAVLHSALTEKERRARWQRLRRGEAHIALGPRSAIWAPVHDVRIIVVDEEHDPSFKQHSDVRYNGRDLAITRAHQAHAVAVLGSATPALESLQAVATGKLTELRLEQRVAGRPMPTVELVDLGREREETHGEPRVLTRALADRLRDTVKAKGQAILFLNRRGFNTIVYCDDCGAARRCTACDVSLTHHKPELLVCHYCGRTEQLVSPCRECKSTAMRPFGVGTQRVAEAVSQEVPDARVIRLDRDVTAHVGELDRTLAAFRAGEADVLVGTQMVAKGHDFPGVTLVGIVLADASLAFPDFRAAERTFQLVTQVAGRAGRADNPGHVIVQTFQPQHYALTCAIHHDTRAFFEEESQHRFAAYPYPPFSRIGIIRFESKDKKRLQQATERARRSAAKVITEEDMVHRGPISAPIAKVRDHHRELMMIVAPTPARLVAAMHKMKVELAEAAKSVDIVFDVDPLDLL